MKILEPQANRIRAAQMEVYKSDKEMSELLGITIPYYRQKLNGKKPWTLKDISMIQAATGKTFNYFYGLSDY